MFEYVGIFDPDESRAALQDAREYLGECDIVVPKFRHRVKSEWGGSYVSTKDDGSMFLCLGCYPTREHADWFAMHELAHVLFAKHRPTRSPEFRRVFGAPEPDDYDELQWKCMFGGIELLRPRGYASVYGRDGGGEEHFAELLAYMYTQDEQFDSRPPADLRRAWKVAWDHGLARMG